MVTAQLAEFMRAMQDKIYTDCELVFFNFTMRLLSTRKDTTLKHMRLNARINWVDIFLSCLNNYNNK